MPLCIAGSLSVHYARGRAHQPHIHPRITTTHMEARGHLWGSTLHAFPTVSRVYAATAARAVVGDGDGGHRHDPPPPRRRRRSKTDSTADQVHTANSSASSNTQSPRRTRSPTTTSPSPRGASTKIPPKRTRRSSYSDYDSDTSDSDHDMPSTSWSSSSSSTSSSSRSVNKKQKKLLAIRVKGSMTNAARAALDAQPLALVELMKDTVAQVKGGGYVRSRHEQGEVGQRLEEIHQALPHMILEMIPGVVWVTGKLVSVPSLRKPSLKLQEAAIARFMSLLHAYQVPLGYQPAQQGVPAAAIVLGPMEPSRMLWGMATAGVQYPLDTVAPIARLAAANAHLMRTQGLSNCTWALSKLVDHYDDVGDCLDVLATYVMENIQDMEPQHLSNVVLAWGHLERIPDCVDMERYGQFIMMAAPRMLVQHFTNTLWALARRNYLPSTIDLELFTSLATRDYSKFNPQNLANLLWALAVFRTQPKAFDPEEHASWVMRKLDSTLQLNLASNLWSWTTLYGAIPEAVHMPTYCKTLNMRAQEEVTAKGITNVWWSFANLGKLPAEFDARLYNTLFLQRLHEAKPMGIANMLYAWTTLDAMPGYDTVERVMSSMVEQITTRQNPDEDCQSVVAALYAAADYRYRPSEDNLLSMMNYIGTYAGYLKPEYANNVLLAAAVLKAKVPDALIVDLLTMTCEWSKQEQQSRWVSNALWACVTLLVTQPARLSSLLPVLRGAAQVAIGCADWITDPAWVKQVYTAHVAIELLLPNEEALLSDAVCAQAHDITLAKAHDDAGSIGEDGDLTIFQRQVSLAAASLFPEISIEELLPRVLLRVDVRATAADGAAVVIEADGPSHCFVNLPTELTGRTLLRNTLLQASGYKLVVMPWQDWQHKAASPSDKLELLRNKLDEAVVVV